MTGEEATNEEFLHELKYTYEQDLNWKNSLDNKANTMITMSSAITTLLIAIVTFLFSRININHSFYPLIILILLGAIIFAIIAILFFIKAYTIKDYRFPVGHEAFFNKNGYDKEMVDKFLLYTKEKFNKHLVREYLESIKVNSANLANKAKNIKYGQYFYLGSISAIVIILAIIIVTTLFYNTNSLHKPIFF